MTMFNREQYVVDCPSGSNIAVLHGVLRLPSPDAYDGVFAPLRERLASGQLQTIDLSDVSFMNSSGIRALASLVLLARDTGMPLRIVVSDKVPWQTKNVASFRAISPSLAVDRR
ncbi:MAG TPA: STAS domain-containing protein [Gemmatimonadaceae bacterium]|nr:STAS domain-containing protein [Gemmatimonadaceae bacterium]